MARKPATTQAERQKDRRADLWMRSAKAIEAAGLPTPTVIGINWAACLSADRTDGHVLGLPETERISVIWDRLWRLAREFGEQEWIAFRAPEYDRTKGLHIHMAARMPNVPNKRVIDTIERLTGAPAAERYNQPRTVTFRGRKCRGVIATGQNGAWMIQRNLQAETGGGVAPLMVYVNKAPRSSQTSARFWLSQDVKRILRDYETGTITPEQARRARGDCHRRASQVSGYPEARNASRPSTAFLRPLEAHQGAAWAR